MISLVLYVVLPTEVIMFWFPWHLPLKDQTSPAGAGYFPVNLLFSWGKYCFVWFTDTKEKEYIYVEWAN